MVAIANLIPKTPEAQTSVLSVLEAHPELRGIIARTSAKAEELVPNATIRLESIQYDEWDPPLQLVVSMPLPWEEYKTKQDAFIAWISAQSDIDLDLILPIPMWTGPLESAT